jgi:hypothetical protein
VLKLNQVITMTVPSAKGLACGHLVWVILLSIQILTSILGNSLFCALRLLYDQSFHLFLLGIGAVNVPHAPHDYHADIVCYIVGPAQYSEAYDTYPFDFGVDFLFAYCMCVNSPHIDGFVPGASLMKKARMMVAWI